MPAPSFQFYPDDFVGSGTVQAADPDEIGAYVLLLCLDWGEVGFAFDERRLAKVCRLSVKRFRYVWGHLAAKFPPRDGRHYNPRLEKERQKQADWHAKSVAGGIASAAKRGKGGARVVEPQHQPSGNTPDSRLQTPTPELQLPPQTPFPTDAKRPRPRAKGSDAARPTWITPAVAAWDAEYGVGAFDLGQGLKELAHIYRRGAGWSPEKIGRALAYYLRVKGLEGDPTREQIARATARPSLRDFRLRHAKFDPDALAEDVA